MSDSRVRIVSTGDSSRASQSRVYLDDKDITHLIKDLKIYVGEETRRWQVEFTVIANLDIDLLAEVEARFPIHRSEADRVGEELDRLGKSLRRKIENEGVPIPRVDAVSTKSVPTPKIERDRDKAW